MDEQVHIMDHPLIQHKLSILRDKNTGVKEFRELVGEIAMLLCFEATRELPLRQTTVETPVCTASVQMLAGRKLAVVPILRAGLGMVDGILALIPAAKVGHIGLYRDPNTLEPVEYYCKLPSDIREREVLLLDPMLATGGSMVHTINLLTERGATDVTAICTLAAPEGIRKLEESGLPVRVVTASVDERLNESGYIVPGLGDAGDRMTDRKSVV